MRSAEMAARSALDFKPQELPAALNKDPRLVANGSGADLRSILQRPLTTFLKALETVTIGLAWERTAAAGMGDHELARINRRNVLDLDCALREFAMTPFGTTRRP
jgi:hypothetical protein